MIFMQTESHLNNRSIWHWPLKFLRVGLMLLGVGVLGYWGLNSAIGNFWGEPQIETLEAKTSPDGALTAKVLRSNLNATAPFLYHVMVQSKAGNASESGEEVLVAQHIDKENIHLEWNSAKQISILMPCGEIFSFTNFMRTPAVEVKLVTNGVCSGS